MYITHHCYYYFFSTEENEEKETSSNLPLIVGISVGAVVLVAVVAILVHCKRSVSRGSQSRVGDGMPAEGGYSKAENYELKQAKPDESEFSLGEKGRLNEGMD